MTTERTFGEFLRLVIQAVGTPIDDLAKDLGVSRRMLYFYMSDKHKPSQKTVYRLCEILGLSPVDTDNMIVRTNGRPKKILGAD